MKAVVLVGGEGTRLRPLTTTIPKPLLPLAGCPLVERQLGWLEVHGVDEVVLSVGYLPDAFVAHFPDNRFSSMRLVYAVEPEPLGTAGAIRFAAERGHIDERFVVCNGDVLTTLDLVGLVDFHRERGATATIHLTEVQDPSTLGAVPTYPDGEVKAFVEKPPPGSAPTNWINAGTYVLEPEVLDRIPAALAVSVERETFPRLLEERGRVYALATRDYWIDVGTPQRYLQASVDILSGAMGDPPLPGARESSPGVWLQGDPDVAVDASLEPPVLIGAGAEVAAGARVAGSALESGSSVGPNAVIDGSVLLAGARVGRSGLVRDSIVGPDACVDEAATVLDHTIVGAGAHVPASTTLAAGRVPAVASAG